MTVLDIGTTYALSSWGTEFKIKTSFNTIKVLKGITLVAGSQVFSVIPICNFDDINKGTLEDQDISRNEALFQLWAEAFRPFFVQTDIKETY